VLVTFTRASGKLEIQSTDRGYRPNPVGYQADRSTLNVQVTTILM
jgi:hypothetical protein